MKSLSILQPFAALIAHGIKDVENRSWETKYRGIVLIHAGKKVPSAEILAEIAKKRRIKKMPELHFGAVIGAFTLADCQDVDHPSPWYVWPNFAWIVSRPVVFPRPIPCVGKLGLFTPPASVIRAATKFLESHSKVGRQRSGRNRAKTYSHEK